MGVGAPGSGPNGSMRRKRTGGAIRFFSRLIFGLLGVIVFTLVSIQFARILNENIAMAHSLSSIERDAAVLRVRKAEQQREIRRLQDAQGAVPEIHERLRLVRPDEAIIYVKTVHPPSP